MIERTKNIDIAMIYELWEQYAATCQAGDFESWMNLWLDTGRQMPPNEPQRLGKKEIRKAMLPTFDQFEMSNMVIKPEQIQILGDYAYSHGTYTFDLKPKLGGETMILTGKFLDILKRQPDGSWKIAIDCHNYNEP